MAKLLHIDASPRGEDSFSTQVAKSFIDEYQKLHPDAELEHRPLFDIDLPVFTANGAGQKMAQIASLMTGGSGIDAEGEWSGVVEEIERLRSADKIVVSSPMWNWSIPYRLKHYIDLVCQPGLSFGVDETGQYFGLITGSPLQFILASGSSYEPRFPDATDGTLTDFQRCYLEHIFGVMGFEDIRTLKIEPTGADNALSNKDLLTSSQQEARKAAGTF